MALLDAEVLRIKQELGLNLLTISSEPWIGHTSVFENIIQPFMTAGASTTSSTAVVASPFEPTPATLVLTSPTGFLVGQRIVVDVDGRQETATAQALSGSSLTLLLSKVHGGTFPVTVEGGESIVREILGYIRDTKSKMSESYGTGSLKSVDEVSFYQAGQQTYFGLLGDQLKYWRSELASALGLSRLANSRSSGSTLSVY